MNNHLSDDDLTAYRRGGAAVEQIEAHLLVCDTCCGRLESTYDGLSRLVRESAQALPSQQAATRTEYGNLRFHAAGGLGEVALAHDAAIGRDVALKRLRGDETPERRRRFLREAAVTGRLEHPGIAPVYGIGEDEHGRPCYAMRFVPGATLADALRQPADLRALLARFVTLCGTVAYAHSRGVVHRDIKPANIAIGTFGETILLDWGLAQVDGVPEPGVEASAAPYDRFESVTGTVLGTPGYMAPEQAAGAAVGPSADIYSLGVTLKAMLPANAPALHAIAAKAMASDSVNRYSSALELGAEIERWLSDQPVHAYPDSLAARLRRWLRRHPTTATATAAALILAVLATSVGAALLANEQRKTERARQDEAHQRARTEQAERETLSAYRDSTDDAIVELIGSRSELSPAEIAYLEGTARRWEALARREGDDHRSRTIRAEGSYELAHIWNRLERRTEARAAFREAINRFSDLANDDPESQDIRRTLAKAHAGLARQLVESGETAAAAIEYTQAVTLQDALLAGEPGSAVLHDERGLSESGLANLAYRRGDRAEAVRRFLLAGTHLQQAAAEPEARLLWRQHLADNRFNLANVQLGLKDFNAADAGFLQSMRDYEALLARDPNSADYSRGVARGHVGLGVVRRGLGQFKAAQTELELGRDAFGRTLAKYPALPQMRRELANVHFNLMVLKRLDGRPADALIDATIACDHFRRLLAALPDAVHDREELAKGESMREGLLLDLARRPEAEAARLAARAEWQTLADRHPDQPHYRVELAGNLGDHASALADDGEPARALEWYGKSLAILEKLAEPAKVENALQYRSNSHAGRAAVYEGLNRHAEALADWTAAIADGTPADRTHLRASRALCRARLREFEEAIAEARELVRDGKPAAEECYVLAAVFSLKGDADASLELLNRSIALGFKDAARLRKDDAFKPLREHAEFQALLAKLAKP